MTAHTCTIIRREDALIDDHKASLTPMEVQRRVFPDGHSSRSVDSRFEVIFSLRILVYFLVDNDNTCGQNEVFTVIIFAYYSFTRK